MFKIFMLLIYKMNGSEYINNKTAKYLTNK